MQQVSFSKDSAENLVPISKLGPNNHQKADFLSSRTKAMLVSGMNGVYNGCDGIRIVTTNGLGVLQGYLTEPIMSLVTSHHSLLACA